MRLNIDIRLLTINKFIKKNIKFIFSLVCVILIILLSPSNIVYNVSKTMFNKYCFLLLILFVLFIGYFNIYNSIYLTIIFTTIISLVLMKIYDIMNNKQYTKKDYFQKSVIFSIVSTISVFVFSFIDYYLNSNISKPTVLNGGNLNEFSPSSNTNFSPINKLRFNSSTPTF